MGEPLTRTEWFFRLAMILMGLAGMAYFAHRLLNGKTLEADTKAVSVPRTGAVTVGPGGHGYQYVAAARISWQDARAAAGKRHWQGHQGYLATIDTAAEFTFITGTLFRRQYPDVTYLGGRQTRPGEWRWVTGPDAAADGGHGLLFWKGYENGQPRSGAFANWMATAFVHDGGRWDVRNVCCVTLFSYRRPQFSTSLGTGSRAEGVAGYLVEFGD